MVDFIEGLPSDGGAVRDGYTQEVHAFADHVELYLLVRPGTDLDDTFRAWDMDGQEFIRVNGWLFNIEGQ
jgi:hypothetical protein